MMKFIFSVCVIFCLGSAVGGEEFKLAELIRLNDGLWQLSPQKFLQDYGRHGFYWLSRRHNQLRYAASTSSLYTLNRMPLAEIIAEFNNRRLISVRISIYNRGDMGEITLKDFQKKLKTTGRFLNKLFNRYQLPRKRAKNIDATLFYTRRWQNKSTAVTLTWSIKPRKRIPQFLTLTLMPAAVNSTFKITHYGKQRLSMPLKKLADGGCYLEVPMVDQGRKGYCVDAVLERVLKYYGSDVDQHLFAELADSSAAGGTSIDAMEKALRDADHKLGVKFKVIYKNLALSNFNRFKLMLTYYNRLARKHHKPLLVLSQFLHQHRYNPSAFIYAADPALLAEMRRKSYRKEADKFFKNIKRYIPRRIPILWSVLLGVYPEAHLNRQLRGGHMRLIIGFNAARKEIYYSDSWGRGHELKIMSFNQAWAMTTAAYIMPPRYK